MHIGWVFSSFLMVAGAFIVSSIAWFVSGALAGEWGLLLFWFLGAFFAGFSAARASEGKTIAEPAIGAGAFVGACLFLVFKSLEDLQGGISVEALQTLEVWQVIAYLVLAFAGGGIGGAYVGERTQEDHGDAGAGILIILTFLNMLGGVFVSLVVAAILGLGGGGLLAVVAAGPLLGGFASARGGARFGTLLFGAILAALPWVLLALRIASLMGDVPTGDNAELQSGLERGADEVKTAIFVFAGFILVVGLIGGGLGRIGQGKAKAA